MPFDSNDAYSAGVGLAGLGVGGALAHKGLKSLDARDNAFVSWGEAPSMGGGHKAPGKDFVRLLQQIKAETPELKNLNIHEVPLGQDGRAAPAMRHRSHILGVDTGWGVLDKERDYKSFLPHLADKDVDFQHKGIGDNTFNKVIFGPDGRSDVTGYRPVGNANALANDPTARFTTYGSIDTAFPRAVVGDRFDAVGRAHPLIDTANMGRRLDPAAYRQVVKDYLDMYNPGHGETVDSLLKKKIITVSGASRGDSVGIRAKLLHDELVRSGKINDHLVLGIGGSGMDEQRLMAHGAEAKPGLFIGGRPGGPKGMSGAFQELLNNSNLHFMGMGGATPFEMMSHGGAPIVSLSDEQVFKGKRPWESGTLDANAGLYAKELERIKELKAQAALLPDEHPLKAKMLGLQEPAPRDWMNTLVHETVPDVNGKPLVLRRGLDAIREFMDHRNVPSVSTSEIPKILQMMDDPGFTNPQRWADVADRTRKSIDISRSTLKSQLKDLLLSARAKNKVMGIAGLAGGGLAALSGILGADAFQRN